MIIAEADAIVSEARVRRALDNATNNEMRLARTMELEFAQHIRKCAAAKTPLDREFKFEKRDQSSGEFYGITIVITASALLVRVHRRWSDGPHDFLFTPDVQDFSSIEEATDWQRVGCSEATTIGLTEMWRGSRVLTASACWHGFG